MTIDIYDNSGTRLMSVEPGDSSTQDIEVMGEDRLTLSFEHYACTVLPTSSWCEYMGGKYRLLGEYKPQMKGSHTWQYDVTLYGTQSMLKRFLVLWRYQGNVKAEFSITGTAFEHASIIVESINEALGTTDFKVGEVDGTTDNITLDYEGTYCDEGLKQLAEKLETEWWIDGDTVNVCRCEKGETLILGYGSGLTGIERQDADNAETYTRLFPMGSTRNIDAGKYGHERLQMAGGKQYLEVNVDKYGVIDRYEKEAFANIYPRYTGTVASVRTTVGNNDDGSTFTIYWIKDSGISFNPDDYMLAGETLRVSFQSGSLNGMGEGDDYYFEANWHEDEKELELVTQFPDDIAGTDQLPGGPFTPTAGDTYMLWNLYMPDELVKAAEQELLEAAEAYNKKHAVDISVYKCTTDHVWMEGLKDSAGDAVTLETGQKVRISSAELFPGTGYRDSRITRITRKVNLPSQMDIEVGDALSTGSMQKMGDSVKAIGVEVRQMSLPEVVRSWEDTKPSDYNVPSFKTVLKYCLSRLSDDTARGVITLLKGLKLGSDGKYHITEGGAATLSEMAAASGNWYIKEDGTAHFKGNTDVGGTLAVGGSSTTHGISNTGDMTNTGTVTTKDLNVTGKAHFHELVIDKIRATGGSRISSAADGFRIDFVEEGEEEDTDGNTTTTIFRLYWLAEKDGKATQNMWKSGDQAVSMNFNLATMSKRGGRGYSLRSGGNKFWWALVTDVSGTSPEEWEDEDGETRLYHWIAVSATDKADGCTVNPEAGDEVAMLGSRATNASGEVDTERQSAIYESSYTSIDTGTDLRGFSGLTAPLWAQYRGIDDFDLSKHRQSFVDATRCVVSGDFYNTSGASIDTLISNVEKGSQVYLHTAYAKDSSGAAGTWKKEGAYAALGEDSRKDYHYIGFCSDYTAEDTSLAYSDYTWSFMGKDGVKGDAAVQYRLLPVSGNTFTTQNITTASGDSGLNASTKVHLSLSYSLLRQEGESYEAVSPADSFTLTASYDGGGSPTVAKTGTGWTVTDDDTEYSVSKGPNSVTVRLTKADGTVCDTVVTPLTLQASHLFAVTDAGLVAAFNRSASDSSAVQGNLDSVETNLQSQITANAGKIEQKVEKTEFDTLSGKVSTNSTKITETAAAVSAQATAINGNTTRIGVLEVSGDRISAKVDALRQYTENLLDMGSVGEMDERNAAQSNGGFFGYLKTVTLATGKTYTVTWQGSVGSTDVYQKVCVYNNGTGSSYEEHYSYGSDGNKVLLNTTSSSICCYKFTVKNGGAYNITFYSTDSKGGGVQTSTACRMDWIRIDEGDLTANPPTEWEPSANDLEAVNLLPDALMETPGATAEDGRGTRELIITQTGTSAHTGSKTENGTTTTATVQPITSVMHIVGKADTDPVSNATNAEGVPYVRFRRSGNYGYNTKSNGGNYGGGNINDGLRWYIPFKGSGKYTLSASFKDFRSVTASSGNNICIEYWLCDASKKRIKRAAVSISNVSGSSTDYGWVQRERTATIADTETAVSGQTELAAGTSYDVSYIELRLFMRQDGDMAVSRMCLSKCSHATVYNAEELSDARKNEATQLATGIDIYNKKIVATADEFEWRDNDGNAMASFDKDNGAKFEGNVSVKTLSAAGGKTTIGEDGVLHASGADIEGGVSTSASGRRATLSGGGVQLYDSSGNLVTEHTSVIFDDVTALTGGLSGNLFSTMTSGGTKSTTQEAREIGGDTRTATLIASQTASATGRMKVGYTVAAYSSFTASSAHPGKIYSNGRVYCRDLTTGTSYTLYATGVTRTAADGGGGTGTVSGSATIPVINTHSYAFYVECEYGMSGSGALYPGGFSCYAEGSITSISYDNSTYHATFFGNGIMLNKGAQNYFAAMLKGSSMLFEIMSGDYGLQILNGIKALVGGTWFPQPRVVVYLRIKGGTTPTVSRCPAGYSFKTSGSVEEKVGVITRSNTGQYKLVLPTDWKNLNLNSSMGGYATATVASVDNAYFASCELTDSQLSVFIASNSKAADVTVDVEIKVR